MADMGLMECGDVDPEIGITTELIPILGLDGHPVSEPWLLDGNGYAIPSGLGSGSDVRAILYKNIFVKRDFTILPGCSAVA